MSGIALRNLLLLLLTNTAGYVDALSYIALGRVFVANMTGNTVLLGLAVIQADGEAALRAGLALLGFLAGGALGAWVVQRGPSPAIWPRGVTIALALEWSLLVALALVALPLAPGAAPPGAAARLVAALVVVSAVAMGMQSAAARRLDVSGVATTFITGTLTTLTTMIATVPPQVTRGRRLLLAVWLTYAVGAMVGGAVMLLVPALAFAVPLVLLLPVIIAAALGFRP